jgi:DNA-binding CsgD family transcriptional regulator
MAQSAPHLAVAQVHDLEAPTSRPRALESGTTARPRPYGSLAQTYFDPWLAEAIEAEAFARPDAHPAFLWDELLSGALVFRGQCSAGDRRIAVLQRPSVPAAGQRLSELERRILVRVLCGGQQKAAASDLSIACSTASKWYSEGVKKLRVDRERIPLPLILAAQTSAAVPSPDVDARSTTFQHEGLTFVTLSTPAPAGRTDPLTVAELEIAMLLIEGATRWEIAGLRATSPMTIACQLRCVHAKLNLRGRYELVHHAAQAGWFR